MHIAVLGTGGVSRTLAVVLLDRGHDVTIGTRDPATTLARTHRARRTGLPAVRHLARGPHEHHSMPGIDPPRPRPTVVTPRRPVSP